VTKQAVIYLFPIIAGVFLFFYFAPSLYVNSSELDFETFALDQETSVYYAKDKSGRTVHCSDLSDSENCIQSWKEKGKRDVALWLGNSQLHAINQMKPGAVNAPQYFSVALGKTSQDSITFSQPNANLQEHYILFQYLVDRLKISTLIIALVYDDTRETGLRTGIKEALQDESLMNSVKASELSDSLKDIVPFREGESENTAMEGSYQKYLEDLLVDELNVISKDWKERTSMRAAISSKLYLYRNTILGINSQTKRKKIIGRYNQNLKALTDILISANSKGIKTLVYIVPLRSDIEPPYIKEEYLSFKEDVSSIARENRVTFMNLENAVPSEFWGMQGGVDLTSSTSIDFMHFQEEGHKLLAKEIYKALEENELLKKTNIN